MKNFEMVNMNKLKGNVEALEHLYLISPLQCKLIGEVSQALTTLSKEFEKESKGKSIESDEKLQAMTFEYIRACHNVEKVFDDALKTLEISGFKF